jgi:hypothetical protein
VAEAEAVGAADILIDKDLLCKMKKTAGPLLETDVRRVNVAEALEEVHN